MVRHPSWAKLRFVTDPQGDAESATVTHSPFTIMAPQQRSAGHAIMDKADKKAASSGGWFTSNNSKWEEAGDLFQEAANAFKIDKLFKEAGDAHAREAECRENSKDTNEAANAWWNAAKAYKRGNPDCECGFGCCIVCVG